MASIYYRKNVPYTIGGRMHVRDSIGFLLTEDMPWISIDATQLRDFKIANKKLFVEGLITEIPEPELDWDTNNSVSDDDAVALVKGSYFELQTKLKTMTSRPVVAKILEAAKTANKPKKTLALIEERINELTEIEDNFQRDLDNLGTIV